MEGCRASRRRLERRRPSPAINGNSIQDQSNRSEGQERASHGPRRNALNHAGVQETSGGTPERFLVFGRPGRSKEGMAGALSLRVMSRMARATVFGKHPLALYLRLSEWIWGHLPRSITGHRLATGYGRLVHGLVRLQGDRRQYFGTFFFRNRAQLQAICRLADVSRRDGALRIAVLGCSLGAEVYSIGWSIRSRVPDAKTAMQGVDISTQALAVAREGVYSLGRSELAEERVFERTSEDEMRGMFDREGDRLRVKSWIKEGIRWRVGDASDPQIVDVLGPQDIVVANDFLCHMEPAEAESCLRNIARLVDSGGYLVVSGIDLDVRTKVANALHWKPLNDSIEDIHEGDRSLRLSWPWRYWGLEPIDKRRPDWNVRYASVFQLGETA
jgi:chemotaxis protein methyltransferase CheR